MSTPLPVIVPAASHRRPGRPQNLSGSRALITGGGRGIGRVTAIEFARAGAVVGLLARSEDELRATKAEIEAEGGTAACAVADVTDEPALRDAIARLRADLGPFDVLVNNAGVVGPIGPVWEVDAGAWWQTMEVNLRGLVLATQVVLPTMVERRWGRIINVSSWAGVYRWPLVSAYSVSKAAVTKLTENLALETKAFGVRAFSVHPGLLPIGMSEQRPAVLADPHELRVWNWLDSELAQGRGADPDAAVELLIRVAAGDADVLSGRHLSVHDDLDALLARSDDVRRRDLYVLHPTR